MMLFYLGIFGILGVFTRFALDTYLNSSEFPLGTLVANILGCLITGIIFTVIQNKTHLIANYFLIGFCGALTTFSSYSLQGFTFLNDRQMMKGLGYLFASPVLGVLFIFIGTIISKNFFFSN